MVGRADLLCALTFCLSFLCYVKGVEAVDSKGKLCIFIPATVHILSLDCFSKHEHEMNVVAEISLTHRTRYSWLLLSSLTCCISVLCKEQGVTVLVSMEWMSCQITPVPLYSNWSFQLHSSSFCQGHRSAFCLSVSVSLSYYPPFYPFLLSPILLSL